MVDLIPIQYHGAIYPKDIRPTISEVAGHFDVVKLRINGVSYSLHTEYSYTSRKLDSDLLKKYLSLIDSNKDGIPMLWYSNQWAEDFADFIIDLCRGNNEPDIIEIHPPFSDYCNLISFFERYEHFERKIKIVFPKVTLLLENRSGARYKGGSFIISNIKQLSDFSKLLDEKKSDLRITLDLPQLLSAHKFENTKVTLLDELFEEIFKIRHNILGIHLWGKRENENGIRVAHSGDLNSFFYDDDMIKFTFLSKMIDVFDDGIVRYFVPEVNSGSEDLLSIVSDLKIVGFKFL